MNKKEAVNENVNDKSKSKDINNYNQYTWSKDNK